MKPTKASEAKSVKSNVPYQRAAQLRNDQASSSTSTTSPTATSDFSILSKPQQQKLFRQLITESLLTNDGSELIDSFETARQYSLEDSQYLTNSFPRNMFDDKGDAIYGTGLIVSLLSFIVTLIKLVLLKKKIEEDELMTQANPKHQQKTSTPNPTTASNLYSHGQPTPFMLYSHQSNNPDVPTVAKLQTQHNPPLLPTVPQSSNVSNLYTQYVHGPSMPLMSASQLPTTPDQSTVGDVIDQSDPTMRFNVKCGCQKGYCKTGPCHCALAKRACGPACHGGKANQKCTRTLLNV